MVGLGRATGTASNVSPIRRWSLTLAPAMTTPTGTPRPSVRTERLTPRLPRSVGLRPVLPPTQGRLAHGSVQRQPRPIDPDQIVVGQQALPPERLEHPGPRPVLEPAMGPGRGADPGGGERVPLASGAQHETGSRPSPCGRVSAGCDNPGDEADAGAARAPSAPTERRVDDSRRPEPMVCSDGACEARSSQQVRARPLSA